MPLIKSNQAAEATSGAVVVDFEDLGRQATRILDDARAKASEIIAKASQEALEIKAKAAVEGMAQGQTEGFKTGLSDGHAKGEAEAQASHSEAIVQLVAQWQTQINSFVDSRAQLLESCRTQAIQLSLAIARRVVYRVVHEDPGVVADQLSDALAMVSQTSEVEVVIHPDQDALVRDVLPDICATLQQVDSVALTLDAAITPGGCLVRTRGGAIDATIETQIDRIIDELIPSVHDGTGL
ncbi:MAG: FliH/SctL family protein [Phycisphaerales bacterium]|nr:FliH/SctL family protein [Phycisphaerales bacterium]